MSWFLAPSSLRETSLQSQRPGPSCPVLTTICSNCSGLDEPAQRAERVLKVLSGRHGLLSDLPGRHLHVLFLQHVDDVARREVVRRQLFGVQPDPHAVVLLAHVRHVAHAFEPCEVVANLNRGEIAQVELIEQGLVRLRIFVRREIHHEQDAGRFLLGGDAGRLHGIGQTGHRQVDAVLHEHLRHVEVRAQLERDRQVVAAVVRALRRHVQHALDAVHLLLDRGGNGVAHDLRAGSRIGARDLHRRRRDFGVLGDRQDFDGCQSRQQDHGGDHDAEDGSIDEEPCHVARPILGSSGRRAFVPNGSLSDPDASS